MMLYNIEYTQKAHNDLRALSYAIAEQYKSPVTAVRYIDDAIKKLTYSAKSYRIQHSQSLLQYGPSPCRVNYKQMVIIYNVLDNTVYIRRVIPANTIAEP
jgi:mRNA-degrading endonuclease RelE of RelBE toxin-antitoxin system